MQHGGRRSNCPAAVVTLIELLLDPSRGCPAADSCRVSWGGRCSWRRIAANRISAGARCGSDGFVEERRSWRCRVGVSAPGLAVVSFLERYSLNFRHDRSRRTLSLPFPCRRQARSQSAALAQSGSAAQPTVPPECPGRRAGGLWSGVRHPAAEGEPGVEQAQVTEARLAHKGFVVLGTQARGAGRGSLRLSSPSGRPGSLSRPRTRRSARARCRARAVAAESCGGRPRATHRVSGGDASAGACRAAQRPG